jgi:hypothetical protein
MAHEPDIIQLNGKRYDARTGHLLSIPHDKATKPKHGSKKIQVIHHETDADHLHTRTERAKTLMRQVVKKPTPAKHIQHKTTISAPPIHRSHQSSRLEVDSDRLARANQAAKSHMVKRFKLPTSEASIRLITTDLPVQPEPVEVTPGPNEDFIPPSQSEVHEEKQSLWDRAVAEATSHTEPHTKRQTHRHRFSQRLGVSTRIVNLSAVALSAVLLIGFVAYQNVPDMSMQLAAERSGVAGALPGYQPAGFGMSGPIQYRPGKITLSFRSHSDNRQFQIQQQRSNWDDVSLVKDYLVAEHAAFQTRQTNNKTVYIYDDHNATWVDKGVWYRVEGNSSLTSEQLLRLAASM